MQDQKINIFSNGTWCNLFRYYALNESLIETNFSITCKTDALWMGGRKVPPADSPMCGWNSKLCTNAASKFLYHETMWLFLLFISTPNVIVKIS